MTIHDHFNKFTSSIYLTARQGNKNFMAEIYVTKLKQSNDYVCHLNEEKIDDLFSYEDPSNQT